ncbi:unnamed protein product [Bursaphelenchus xylophilus]|nr:unnamed protein product [Bursaphelenchus xylophilus]CAG9125193.1 unnamed protein product [Bursaphelenchus xylophilus]
MFSMRWSLLLIVTVLAMISSAKANPFLMSRLPTSPDRLVYALPQNDYQKRDTYLKRGFDYEDDTLLRFG